MRRCSNTSSPRAGVALLASLRSWTLNLDSKTKSTYTASHMPREERKTGICPVTTPTVLRVCFRCVETQPRMQKQHGTEKTKVTNPASRREEQGKKKVGSLSPPSPHHRHYYHFKKSDQRMAVRSHHVCRELVISHSSALLSRIDHRGKLATCSPVTISSCLLVSFLSLNSPHLRVTVFTSYPAYQLLPFLTIEERSYTNTAVVFLPVLSPPQPRPHGTWPLSHQGQVPRSLDPRNHRAISSTRSPSTQDPHASRGRERGRMAHSRPIPSGRPHPCGLSRVTNAEDKTRQDKTRSGSGTMTSTTLTWCEILSRDRSCMLVLCAFLAAEAEEKKKKKGIHW